MMYLPITADCFLPDEILENISISDEILYTHLQAMSRYDYSSEVDVNILGHIFEHSLTEIERLTPVPFSPSPLLPSPNWRGLGGEVSKRKKNGVFYTPQIDVEVRSSKSRADAVVKTKEFIYVFEFKLNGTAEEALQQIDEKGYLIPYQFDGRKLVKVGVEFCKEERNIHRFLGHGSNLLIGKFNRLKC